MDLSIIFVNWNSAEYLLDSIASIRQHTSGIAYEIIVVENASPRAGEAELLERELSGVMLLKSPRNLGFAGANNLGFRESSGRNLLFLNPDTKLTSPALEPTLRRLETLPGAGITGCKLLNGDLSLQTSCIQTFPTILNQVFDTDYLRRRWPNCQLWGTAPLFSLDPEPAEVEVISGACLMIKREVFEQVGGFTEDYFMYAEDLDLCYKVHRAGFRNYYVKEASLIHYGGKSSSPLPATTMKWKAIPRFCDKHRGRAYGLLFRGVMALTAVGRLSLIAVASPFAGDGTRREGLQMAAAKWRIVLKSLLGSSRERTASSQKTLPGRELPQV